MQIIVSDMSDSEEESQDRQLKFVVIGDGASGKVRAPCIKLPAAGTLGIKLSAGGTLGIKLSAGGTLGIKLPAGGTLGIKLPAASIADESCHGKESRCCCSHCVYSVLLWCLGRHGYPAILLRGVSVMCPRSITLR